MTGGGASGRHGTKGMSEPEFTAAQILEGLDELVHGDDGPDVQDVIRRTFHKSIINSIFTPSPLMRLLREK